MEEGKFSKLEDMSFKIIHSDKQKIKGMRKNEDIHRDQ